MRRKTRVIEFVVVIGTGKLEAALTKHDMVGSGAGFIVPAVYLSHLYQWTDKRQAATILQLAIGCEALTVLFWLWRAGVSVVELLVLRRERVALAQGGPVGGGDDRSV